ncbi:MAG TPA: type I secretion system permease/ATPase [Pseudomonadales bacterium]|nr:type I secretion system permease/ATPase [Pseudomonadales bacterium]
MHMVYLPDNGVVIGYKEVCQVKSAPEFSAEIPVEVDTGILCLVAICRFHQLAVEPAQIEHEYGNKGSPLDDRDLQCAAKSLGMRCRATQLRPPIDNAILPAIARHRDGSYFILARADAGKYLMHDLRQSQPQVVTAEVFETISAGTVLLMSRRRHAIESLQQKFDIRWFIPALMKYRKLFAEVVLASFFLQLLALVTPLFFQVVMDKVLVHNGVSTLDVLAIGFLMVCAFEAMLGCIRSYVFSHTTHRVDVELGAALFRHLQGLPIAYFQARPVGQSVARVRELDSVRQFITGTALTLLIDLSFTFVFLAVMFFYSVSLTLLVLATIPVYMLLSWIVTPVLRARLDQKFRHSAANQSFLVESVTGAQTIKSLALEPQMQRRWEDQLADYVTSSFRTQNFGNVASQCAGLISKLTTLGIIWWGAHLVMQHQLSVGQLVAFNMLAGRISGPILKLVQLAQDFQQARISVDRLGDILNTPREPGLNAGRSMLPALQGQVTFENVRFRYRVDTSLILDDVSLQVSPGEIIGVVGKSGSGKSTLTKLLQRLYVPEAGRVLVDGMDLANIDASWLRRQIGVVLQDNFLFRRTVRENIAVANPAMPIEMVVQAAKLAGAHEFITALPEAYDTVIEEHGANLSGGQRQRIAIARALMGSPRILVFDEATSALDYESERIIQNNMAEICKNRTVFIIAHRLSTVRGCDRIIVMEKGRIIEQGTHEQLIAAEGHYAQLHRYQNTVTPFRQLPRSRNPRQYAGEDTQREAEA